MGLMGLMGPMWHLPKLLEKPNIILEQQPNVIELVTSRARAIDAEAERKAGEFFRIDIRSAQNIGVHHPRPAQLNPYLPFADTAAVTTAIEATVINLSARLGER